MSFSEVAVLLGQPVEETECAYAVFSTNYLKDVVDTIASG
jgi:hypothetical protein